MHIHPQRASLEGFGSEIFKLVSYGATPEQWAEWLRVPLEHAVARGNMGLVNTLLRAGANGSAGWRGCRGRTLLDAAAVGGSADVVTALIRAGARPDVNVVSLSPKRSSLFVATVCGHEEVARLLVLARADVSFEDCVEQCSVLHEAAWGCHEQLVNELLIGGADPNCVEVSSRRSTPLHQAAAGGHAGVVSSLLLWGANKDARDDTGESPVMWAARDGHLAVVETLSAAGADFDIQSIPDGESPLHVAAQHGGIPVLNAVLEHGVDANARDDLGCSALHHAAVADHVGAVDALIKAGADIELKEGGGRSPLFLAACYSNCGSMLALLRRGAAVRVHDYSGQTPLHRACLAKCPGLEAAVGLLLRWGADETTSDNSGEIPLDSLDRSLEFDHRRCSPEQVERARILLARAPVDRRWRRRCWLVMVRSRVSKAGGSRDDSGGNSGGGSKVAGERAGEVCKFARTEDAAGGRAEIGAPGRTNNGEGGAGAGALGNGEDLSNIVALLVGLELEDVFRTVVGFL